MAKLMKSDSKTPDFDRAVANMLNRELLKYAASKYMFCKGCGQVLDWKTVILVEASMGEKKASVAVCTKCYNPKGLEKLEAQGYEVEVTRWEE